MLKIRVRIGKYVSDWNGNRLKSDLVLSSQLPVDIIDSIVENVEKELIKLQQPVSRNDVTTTTHYMMVKMGFGKQAVQYLQFIEQRRDGRLVPKEKLKFIKCQYCGTENDASRDRCEGCGRPLNKSDIKTKIV
ncbi:MAG: hypothetical protein JRN26_04335 [Nitrososphaerota archaeon]|nr:hypothetical protein [Nitrososphaerota archaeon]MDG6932537.1 hypothetical protein [Nitrososphaerota archaeon]MDG6936092.1 hypothetical protein [Nitrososphaerota archaeon]MDG6944528.1 hypothetical protein [Nitrososphaerota archaeon]